MVKWSIKQIWYLFWDNIYKQEHMLIIKHAYNKNLSKEKGVIYKHIFKCICICTNMNICIRTD